MPEVLDPTQWPKWMYHVALPPVMVATPEEAAALPEGFRPLVPFSAEEQDAHATEAPEAEEPEEEEPDVPALKQPVKGPFKVPRRPAAKPTWTPSGRSGRRK